MRAIIFSSRGKGYFLHRSRVNRLFIACFQSARHSTYAADCTDKTISLPIGNNGAISLRITRPSALNRSKGQSSQKPNVILYLPPGPLFPALDPSTQKRNEFTSPGADLQNPGDIGPLTSLGDSPQHVLASRTSAVVVTVNYRLGEINSTNALSEKADLHPQETSETSDQAVDPAHPQPQSYKYPTPVHDTLAGFDWIHANLQPAQLAVVGTHIGGSLALMLSLTEARSIKAVAALEPVCDWPGLDEYCTREPANTELDENAVGTHAQIPKPKRQRKKAAPSDLVPLLEARSRFFSTPERCFDSFASPVLLLRSAGRDVPRAFPRYLTGPDYPVPVLRETRNATAEDAVDESIWDQNAYPDADGNDVDELAVTVTRRRKALSRWPPYGLDYGNSGNTWSGPGDGIDRLQVSLPWVKVFARDDSVHSAVESDTLGRTRSKTREVGVGSTVLARQADEMVSVMRRACFWGREKGFAEQKVTLSSVNDDNAEEVGEWFHNIFQGIVDDID